MKNLNMPSFDKARVLVVGDVMLDSYWTGPARRISPEAPVPVVKVETMTQRPGGAANVALNLAKLGCHVDLLGIVGDDAEGEALAELLYQQHVHCHFYIQKKARTITKLRVLAQDQQMLRLDFENSFAAVDHAKLTQLFEKALAKSDVVIFSDYKKGSLENIQAWIKLAKAKGCEILIDPKGHDYSSYQGANVLTPNLAEFEAVVGECRHDVLLMRDKAHTLIKQLQCEALLVTLGKEGMTLYYADQREPVHLSSEAREVYDVTGAGDTVIAVLGACRALAMDYESAITIANLAAGLVVGKVGTAYVSLPELRDSLRQRDGLGQGIVSEAELMMLVTDAKAKGEKIVMTNGCFDILHPGHVQYLNQAKQLGDRLVIAVNTDASVRRLKGESRPVNNLEARTQVLSALRCVDWVVAFDEDTPARLIKGVLPDVLVKGGDYSSDTVVGRDSVEAAGGKVVILPLKAGYSTTNLIEKLKK
jgi:D-beta-D-heptose 7-phosphate kinase/D-beta-D-heptose 1-phosphate adenosyltransferase